VLFQVIASHAYTTVKHCLAYEATVAKVEGNRDILNEVVGLVKEVAATFPQVCVYANEQMRVFVNAGE
jgi:hypothetical protein